MASFFRDDSNYYDDCLPNNATDTSIDEESYYNRIVPLIFAVNAISTETDVALFDNLVKALEVSSLVGGESSTNAGHRNSMGMAASLVSSTATNMAAARRTISLFRSEDDEDDDSDMDDYCADGMVVGINPNANTGRNFLVSGLRRQVNNNSLNSSNHGANSTTSSSRQSTVPNSAEMTTSSSSTLFDNNVASYARVINSENSKSGFFPSARIVSVSSRYGFPPSKNPSGSNNLATALSSAVQSLQGSQQQYYQNVRKRPQPNHQNQQQMSYNNVMDEKRAVIQSVFSEYKSSMAGILPSGWIEKHVHALPSVIIVVCTVSSTKRMTDQKKQDSFLYETIEHLQYSLVPKRRCRIQIVALLHPDVTSAQADTWTTTVMNEILANAPNVDDLNTSQASASASANNNIEVSNGQVSIISLRVGDDIEHTTATTPSMKILHKAVRDASLLYYLRQARRCRSKLSKLLMLTPNDDSVSQARRRGIRNPGTVTSGPIKPPPPVLSPIIIRTCIKAAIFYEFQLSKYEKVTLFYNEAYRYAMRYYEWLIRTDNGTYVANGMNNRGMGDDDNASNCSSEYNYSVHGASSSENGDMSEGIEIEINTAELSSSTAKSFSTGVTQTTRIPSKLPSWSRYIPLPSDDTMSFQTRIIAERLFAKLSNLALSSQTDHGYHALTNLWRHHTRTFGVSSEKFEYPKSSFRSKPTAGEENGIPQADTDNHVEDEVDDTIVTSDSEVLLHHTGWYDWLCISRERLLMCLMLQQYPIDDVKTVIDAKVVMECSIWRAYVSATEAMLKLGREMEQMKLLFGPVDAAETNLQPTINGNAADLTRHRYVGSTTSETLEIHYQKELNRRHQGALSALYL
jgi:hypothetical protein